MSAALWRPMGQGRRFPGLAGLGPLRGRRVLLRADLNVPLHDGVVGDASRLDALKPTLDFLRERGARTAIISHFGRPSGREAGLSLRPVAAALATACCVPVVFAEDCIGPAAEAAIRNLPPGGILVLENTRFHPGEEGNDADFADALARLGDAFVNDAFSAAHRAHASTEGLARRLPAVAGFALQAELTALEAALGAPMRPVLAVVGGAKVSSKLAVLGNLIGKVDCIAIGGGMANTFLFAEGRAIGKSLAERDMVGTARQILAHARRSGTEILLPQDVVVAGRFAAHAPSRIVAVDAVPADAMILDLGPQSVARIAGVLARARTVVWNGPLGAFELSPFDGATRAAAGEVARLTRAGQLLSVAGGGDTLAALNRAMAARDFSFVSTAGGAFLEWLEGKPLPGIEALLPSRS